MLPVVILEFTSCSCHVPSVCHLRALFYKFTKGPRLMGPSSSIFPILTNHPKTGRLERTVINFSWFWEFGWVVSVGWAWDRWYSCIQREGWLRDEFSWEVWPSLSPCGLFSFGRLDQVSSHGGNRANPSKQVLSSFFLPRVCWSPISWRKSHGQT